MRSRSSGLSDRSMGVPVKPHVLLRAASALTVVHAALHTIGGLFGAPTHGQPEIDVRNAMQGFRFDAMGSLRSYWDFYFGFGLFVSVSLSVLAILMWQLGGLARLDPARARPPIATLCLAFVAFTLVSCGYFFVAPIVVEAIIAVLLALAWVACRVGTETA